MPRYLWFTVYILSAGQSRRERNPIRSTVTLYSVAVRTRARTHILLSSCHQHFISHVAISPPNAQKLYDICSHQKCFLSSKYTKMCVAVGGRPQTHFLVYLESMIAAYVVLPSPKFHRWILRATLRREKEGKMKERGKYRKQRDGRYENKHPSEFKCLVTTLISCDNKLWSM